MSIVIVHSHTKLLSANACILKQESRFIEYQGNYLMNYQEALNYISSVNWKGSRPGLERISELMNKLGNPQDCLKFIHIAGTNGKGSAAAFISNILRTSGYKVGLFISPFIEVFNERMQINNQNISDEELAEITEYIKPFAEKMQDLPTEFELNTAIALVYFSRNNCDIVVLEVGMGGEFDATNIIKSPEVAVITAIGLDHVEYLGDTVEKIAATKSGIIKPGCEVVLYRQSQNIIDVIDKKCTETGASLHISNPANLKLVNSDIDMQEFETSDYGRLTIHLTASYQKNNLAVVLTIVDVLKKKGYHIDNDSVKLGLSQTYWPGRFEILQKDPIFLVDGAHNPQGIEATAASLRSAFKDKKIIFVFGVLADKNYNEMLDTIAPLARCIICVSPTNSRALSVADLANEVRKRNLEAVPCDTVRAGVDKALSMANADDVICAIGSLYMIGDIKTYM